MNKFILTIMLLTTFVFTTTAFAQSRKNWRYVKPPAALKIDTKKAIIIDDRLAVLRASPSLYSKPVQRMRGGREIEIGESKNAEGIVFFRVFSLSRSIGWIQADAVAAGFRKGDDGRLARLVNGSVGFDRIERAAIFLKMFPASDYRPPILLLYGDLIEDEAAKLSTRANRGLDRREMAASGAPLHSFYLNYPFLDRYRKMGIVFLFNAKTKRFHYDGATWKELVQKFPNSPETAEAEKRLESLGEKLEKDN